ncbi:MAG TPA: TetR/AcrR family transcriptional regulator [Jiangellaceae bacterium]|nr:TetR/AcrR family transcriptional regulator [Jiangellaceae bacterium]
MAEDLVRPARYTADSLLEVAVDVFTVRGYDGTSMGDLARAAGMSKSSIYHHVSGKEHLLRLALERALDPLFAVLDEPAAQTGPAIDRLEHVVRREVQVLVDNLPYVTLLLRVRGNTATERWALDRRRAFDAQVTELASVAAGEGALRSDIDPALVTRLLFGMINSITEWYRPGTTEGNGSDSGTDVGDAAVALAFDGLRT